MKKHIMHSDFIKKMVQTNAKYADDVLDRMAKHMQPFFDEAESAEKGDEALFVFMYHRKGNDYLTTSRAVRVKSTSLTVTDAERIEYQGTIGFFNDEIDE